MHEPSLVILAAGMGSRYGGLKQIDTVGSNGESIIDFSIYDAIIAGFKKVYLIIRREHEEAFKAALTDKIARFIQVEFVFQDLNDLPEGYSVPEGREKPWGTTHALLACRNQVHEPFAIINADDYYGRDAFEKIYGFLKNDVKDDAYGMVGYKLNNTLTDAGTVSRGVCEVVDGHLHEVVERLKIARKDGGAAYTEDGENWTKLADDSLVSMNYWGFTPKVFETARRRFDLFLARSLNENPMKCEHVLPTMIGECLEEGSLTVKVLSSAERWFGVTYREDKPEVVAMLAKMKEDGKYPFDLWK
ncbi:MAG TPA: nucleotidyltransferase [Erysipelotrichaceae bacterium]|nr:nucleotidyltransferase [Erysipelotrichaceae bacterium]HAO61975.1 nucleotidyltransferase [Erysipelotrichaceae bacterium]